MSGSLSTIGNPQGGDSSMKCPDVCVEGLKITHYEGRLR